MTAAEALRQIPVLIPSEDRWSTDEERVPGAAGTYGYGSKENECLCAAGALVVALGGLWGASAESLTDTGRNVYKAAVSAFSHVAGEYIYDYNDSTATLEELHRTALEAADLLESRL
jgi:hypothetical protein